MGYKKLHSEGLLNLYTSPNIIRRIKSRKVLAEHVAHMEDEMHAGFWRETWWK